MLISGKARFTGVFTYQWAPVHYHRSLYGLAEGRDFGVPPQPPSMLVFRGSDGEETLLQATFPRTPGDSSRMSEGR